MTPAPYTVTLTCTGCGATAKAERWPQNEPYPDLLYRCPDCVVKEGGR